MIKLPVKLYVRFFTFFVKIQKKHDFLRFFELLHTFSRTVGVADLLKHVPPNMCYHAEFGRSAIKGVGGNTGELQN